MPLTPELRRFIEDRVNTGRFASAEDVIRAGLSVLQAQERAGGDDLTDLRGDVGIGLAQADRDEFASFTAAGIIREENGPLLRHGGD